MPLDDIYYPELYKHRQKLRRLARWDGRGLIVWAGSIFLGAGLGALVVGTATGLVWASLGLGGGLLLGGLLIGRAKLVSASDVEIEFNQVLSVYEEKPAIKEMREHYDKQLPAPPTSWGKRLRRIFNY